MGWGLVDEIASKGGDAVFIYSALDGSPAAADRLARDAADLLGGRIDILVNGVELPGVPRRPGLRDRDFDRVFAADVPGRRSR